MCAFHLLIKNMYVSLFFREIIFTKIFVKLISRKILHYFFLFIAHYSLHYRTTHLRDDRLQ